MSPAIFVASVRSLHEHKVGLKFAAH